MSPDQCCTARERLNWTRHDLATVADVPLWFVAAFEDGRDTPGFLAGYEIDMCRALEAVGIGFLSEIEDGQDGPPGVS